jgi:hypothetical protein
MQSTIGDRPLMLAQGVSQALVTTKFITTAGIWGALVYLPDPCAHLLACGGRCSTSDQVNHAGFEPRGSGKIVSIENNCRLPQ